MHGVGPDKQCFRHSRRLLPGFHMLETQASRRISRVMKHELVRICHHAPTLQSHVVLSSHRSCLQKLFAIRALTHVQDGPLRMMCPEHSIFSLLRRIFCLCNI